MTDRKKVIPEFTNEEQEAEFWDAHSPLDYEPTQKMRKIRTEELKDRPITIRLDSESRLRLQEMAEAYRLGPSTLARLIIMAVIDQWVQRKQIAMTLDDVAANVWQALPPNLLQEAEMIFKETIIGTPENPKLFVLTPTQLEFFANLTKLLFPFLLERGGVKVIAPEDETYKLLKEKVQM